MASLNDINNNPLVSVIVNCYNGESYLEECLTSIQNQTYQNWEVIFWDNHSTDSSKQIFKKFTDKRFKYYLSPAHMNLYEARDLAVKASSGDFITFCDVDDFWEKNRLQFPIPLFKNKNIGIVYCNQWLLNNKTKKKTKLNKGTLLRGNLFSEIISKKTSVTILTAIVRKSEYLNLDTGFNKNYQIIGDFDFFVRISKKCTYDCVQEPLVFYRLHENNFTRKNRELELEELEKWHHNIKSLLSDKELGLIKEMILYKKITVLIFKKQLTNSFKYILKYPNNFKKIKLLLALSLPTSILEKLKDF
tara:strand:- start:5361 stop:6272 length:912 start_codon:yes stop_codon:yes gene_type:complete